MLRNHVFSQSTEQEWEEAVKRSLKGKDAASLQTKTYENIILKPLYSESIDDREHPGVPPYTRGIGTKELWICQENQGRDAEAVKEAVRKGIRGGENTISFKADSLKPDEVIRLLSDLPIDEYPVFTQAGRLQQAIMESGLTITGSVTRDLIMEWVQAGGLPINEKNELANWISLIGEWGLNHPDIKTIMVDTTPYHEAGADAASEIAYALAAGVEYMNAVQAAGLDQRMGSKQMVFSFAVDSQFFSQIGKLRAARRLWSTVGQAYGVEDCMMVIHAKTSGRNKSSYDRHVNLLRTSNEAFAALAGGCQYITVSPFDTMLSQGSSLGVRMARNIVHILKEEAGICQTEDPGGGSYYLEALTDKLCEKAWERFLELERTGGILAALKKGTIQTELSGLARKRLENVSLRKEKIIGVNAYANPAEARPDVAVKQPIEQSEMKMKEIPPLKPITLSSEFEVIRSMNLSWHNEEKAKRIGLAGIGELKAYKPYMDFAKEILASGGLGYQAEEGISKTEEIQHFIKKSEVMHLIICGKEEDLHEELSALALAPHVRVYTIGDFSGHTKYQQIDRSVNMIEWLTVLSSTQEVEA